MIIIIIMHGEHKTIVYENSIDAVHNERPEGWSEAKQKI